ncbi:MAG: hypothetical protein IIC03_06255, partial [Proteobacteria bacterium]|nr:hypothetical protein [Pseudomonadota bacterium]
VALRKRADEVGQPGALDQPAPGLGGRRVLIEGIEEAKFGYYGAARAGAEAEWRERWDGAGGLPALIALEVAFPAGDPRSWPELVVAPRYGAGGWRSAHPSRRRPAPALRFL